MKKKSTRGRSVIINPDTNILDKCCRTRCLKPHGIKNLDQWPKIYPKKPSKFCSSWLSYRYLCACLFNISIVNHAFNIINLFAFYIINLFASKITKSCEIEMWLTLRLSAWQSTVGLHAVRSENCKHWERFLATFMQLVYFVYHVDLQRALQHKGWAIC